MINKKEEKYKKKRQALQDAIHALERYLKEEDLNIRDVHFCLSTLKDVYNEEF